MKALLVLTMPLAGVRPPAVAVRLPNGAPGALPALTAALPANVRLAVPLPEIPRSALREARELSPEGAGGAADPMGKPTDDSNWKGQIAALLYPVIFSEKPEAEVDRALSALLDVKDPIWSREGFSRAIKIALAGQEPLAGVIPQPHSEKTVRAYLAAVQAKLEK